jgi:hypothetical protein
MQTPKPLTYKGKILLQKVLDVGKQMHPDAPPEHHRAFANSVLELVRNEADIAASGPSCREYAVSRASAGDGYAQKIAVDGKEMTAIFPDGRMPRPGKWSFERACEFAEPLCYGKLTPLHHACFKTEPCFDEAEEDLKELKKIFNLAGDRICKICKVNPLRHNNKSGICSKCQQNRSKKSRN